MKVAVVCIPAIKNDVKASTIYSGLSIESSPEFTVLAINLAFIYLCSLVKPESKNFLPSK